MEEPGGLQARVIGLALLQGHVTFAQLESVREQLAGEDQEGDAHGLLAGLLRARLLDATLLKSLQEQVDALGQVFPQAGPPGDSDSFVPLASLDDLGRTAQGKMDKTEGLDVTPTRVLWATVASPAGRAGEAHRRLRDALTFPRWNQYRDLRFVGEGGMGRIFQAWDPNLRRRVALKFLHRNDPEMAARLLREAQHQAQVDHPNICRVYEVREWKGQVYVAMQYIEGTRLDHAVALDREVRVKLMETVARAVHAAHRHGLVHRDLKPANIMVEAGEDGELKPYVMDFGLARDLRVASETEEGTILGTVHYMAPEQARGDLTKIERRTDVYALGVTLYEGLAGKPPFADVHGLECLLKIQREDVPPLRRVAPDVPTDLDTIVMKCLEKDPAQRYESAGALAEDLRRYSEGEPILARRATLRERGVKLLRKHKPVAALLGLALAATLFFAAFGTYAWFTAQHQAQWAQHFGQEAERIEALLRYARLQPIHDIRPELEAVEGRLEAMRASMEEAGTAALGPGHYALGRAYLALDRTDLAQDHLDRAWRVGFRTPDAAYARGRILARRYLKGIQEADRIQDRALRTERIQELEETLRDPAVALLRQGQGSSLEPPAFQEGLLALVDQRFGEAVVFARKAARAAPWFYEAQSLVAEVALAEARRTQDPEKGLQLLAAAGEALDGAQALAPSDPRLCELASRRWWAEASLRRRTGGDLSVSLSAFERSCDRWDRIRPGDDDALARRAWGWVEAGRGARAGDLGATRLSEGVRLAEQVLGRQPDHPEALGALATGLRVQAYAAMEHGQEARQALDRAIALLRKALERAPSAYGFLDQLATAYWARLELEKTLGRDPTLLLREAQGTLGALAGRFPHVADFDGYLGGFLEELADYEASRGVDPGATTRHALEAFDRALRAQPRRFEFHYGRGNAHLTLASYLVHHGGHPEASLEQAEAAYRAALGENPKAQGAQFGLVEAQLLRAWQAQREARPVLPWVERAEAGIKEAQGVGDMPWRLASYRAMAHLLRARAAADPGTAVGELQQADRAAAEALRDNALQPSLRWLQAQIQLEWALRVPGEAARHRQQAKAFLRGVLRTDPGHALAKGALARLEPEG